MKLITFDSHGTPTPGVVKDGHVLDLSGHLVRSVLEALVDRATEERVRRAVGAFSGHGPAVSSLKLLPPIPRPGKILCIGQNYADHCAEQNQSLPERPILFAKFPSCVIGPGDPIVRPAEVEKLDYEAELVVVIGRRARKVARAEALGYVAGYMIGNDVTAREIQKRDGQWVRGKSFDTFAPLGPFLVTADEIPNPGILSVKTWVNGELRQDSNTSNLVFDVPALIENLSAGMTLEPGDLIYTGTPGGVGVFRTPPVFLQPGDTVAIEIEGLGRLENPVAGEV
ncbi:MAG TPA: fumarylacetoacetate hydrolase family protein [Armatimonadota bacterium]|jgi:2-keto-4-pentenoate hydratase/2-oxohepta-3-ene-1,7-dioic acid hydratase in catechol pathway